MNFHKVLVIFVRCEL